MIHQCHNSINAHYHYVHHYIITTQITSDAGVPFKCTVISWLKSDLHTLQFGLSILIIRFMALLDAAFSALHDDDCFDNVAFQVDHALPSGCSRSGASLTGASLTLTLISSCFEDFNCHHIP